MDTDLDMHVIKRNGSKEVLSYKKILERTKRVGEQFDNQINYTNLVMKIIDQLHNNISTSQIDEMMCQLCASMGATNYDYYTLASHLCISNHQKEVCDDFVSNYHNIFNNDEGYLSREFLNIIDKHQEYFRTFINNNRDYEIDYFGFKTLERAYLMKYDGKICERIQHLWLRVAIQIHNEDLEKIKTTYEALSQKYFIHATPTLFNSGTKRPQLSSCYLIAMEDDSIDGIFNTLHDCASISKWAGGIGLHLHNIRGKNTKIVGTNGTSNGIVPMLKVFNNTARYVDQCVIPETYIYTVEGPKQIQYVKTNEDHIYNELGKTEVIQNVLEHTYTGSMLNIKTNNNLDELCITPEHPVFSILNIPNQFDHQTIKNQIDRNLLTIDYNEAKELNTKSMIGYVIPTHFIDNETITMDDCYMYGLMIGGINMNNKETSCRFVFDTISHERQLGFVKSYLNSHYINYVINIESENKVEIIWSRGVDFKFKYVDLHNNLNKKCITSKYLNLPLKKVNELIKGILTFGEINDDSINFTTKSRELVEQMNLLFLKNGVMTQTRRMNKNMYMKIPLINTICDMLCLDHLKPIETPFFKYGNNLFTRIENISKSFYKGVVYDLQMKHEHNYMIHNGIVHNGGGKRSGSFAMYLEPWHSDIEAFLELRKNHGDEELRARDLFYALWIPDLFMKKVDNDEYWYLMCPHQCPGLSDSYGDEFESLYQKYVDENKYSKKMKARELWFQLLDSQMETGTPYMLYKDAANKKSNQQNLGVIKSSNLCTEIMEYSDKNETAVCNLASISLSAMVNENRLFDYEKLGEVTEIVTENLNKIIDVNFYPTTKTHTSNMNHRPIGIGVQGLADCFAKMDLPFDSTEAQDVNRNIFETIYYHTMKKSNEISKNRNEDVYNIFNEFMKHILNKEQSFFDWVVPYIKNNYYNKELKYTQDKNINDLYHKCKPHMNEIFGKNLYNVLNSYVSENNDFENIDIHNIKLISRKDNHFGSYSSFEGSPLSYGKFQFDLWNVSPSNRYNWDELRESIITYGTRNSLCVAPMPTASTSQILANNECFEPFTSNLYTRRTLAGEFVIINKYLMKELKDNGLWSINMKNMIIENKGSIQNIQEIPDKIKKKYKIVWDMSMKRLIDMAKDRGAFICQSQSMNLWVEDPNYKNLTSMHFYAWRCGLKTGIYYLRRKAKHQAQQFTIEPKKSISYDNIASKAAEEDDEGCLMCGA